MRNEIARNCRYYFLHTGISNALVNNFNPLQQHNDTGELRENYLVLERLKRQECLRQSNASRNWIWSRIGRAACSAMR
jgi:hypothetical protein